MHIVSNIRNIDRFNQHYDYAARDCLTDAEVEQNFGSKIRAHHYDLVVGKVVATGSTVTEDIHGRPRALILGEWLVAPLVGRESSKMHSSVLPARGVGVGETLDYICTGGGLGVSLDNPPGVGDAVKVKVMGIVQHPAGRNATTLDYALDLTQAEQLVPVIGLVGSRSDAGKTTVGCEMIKSLHDHGLKVGVVKLSGTPRRVELQELATHADQALDVADAGLPTTYPPSQEDDDRTAYTSEQVILAASRVLRALSVDNNVIFAEFGGDLLSASVPELLADPARLNLVALLMVAESATAAIGMETKLDRLSPRYSSIPRYFAGPAANLQANRNRILRETRCNGCFDLWNQHSALASPRQREASAADARRLAELLLKACRPA